MNETIKNILERRSIRKFKTDMIPDESLELIIKAGQYAPSTKGRQERHILVIKGLDKVKELNALVKSATVAAKELHQKRYADRVLKDSYSINFDNAPLFVIVTSNTAEDSNSEADAAVVLENMFIAAHSLGIGSVWINQLIPISDVPEFRSFLDKMGVPAEYTIYGCGAFGYNAGDHPAAAPRKENTVKIYE